VACAAGRVALVTDAIMAAGVGDGLWHLGAVEVEVRSGVVRKTADGVLAGSVLTMREAVRNLIGLGATLEQALDAAARVPARAARCIDLGSIAPGAAADVVILDDNLELLRVLVNGQEPVALR